MLVGALAAEGLMAIAEIVGAGLPPSSDFASAKKLSQALREFSGHSLILFTVGLLGTAFLALVVISIG
jgi:hypothetical protein